MYRDARCVFTTADVSAALAYLASGLHFAIAQHSRALFVHAGVVAWRGRTIVLPATTHGGKTTLVMALMKLGAAYYSDEYALFDPDGRVRSYRKPLSVREPDGGVRLVKPEPGSASRALPVGMVLFTRYRKGGLWRPRPVSPAACMLGLIENTVMARTRAEDCMSILRCAAAGSFSLRTARGEADEAADRILKSSDW